MKNRIILLGFLFSLVVSKSVIAQLSQIPPNICKEIKPNGWVYFYENTLNSGQLTSAYSFCFFPQGSHSQWEKEKEWDDNQINFHHILYQQTCYGIEVEGCQFTEHSRQSGKVVYAHGKICSQIHTKYSTETIDENVAMKSVLQYYNNSLFAWEDTNFENQIKFDSGDSTMTYYPTGELVFTFNDDYATIQYDMNPNDFRMAWKFDIVSLAPNFHRTVYVDAITGNVFKEIDNYAYDGSANIPYNGLVVLDTRNTGFPFPKNILHTNNGSVEVHTKINKHPAIPWSLKSEVKHEAPNWGVDSVDATAPHWAVTETWKYFNDKFARDGLDGNGGTVRVFAKTLTNSMAGAYYDHGIPGLDKIYVTYDEDTIYYGEISVLAHEYTHGINYREGKLAATNEQGALGESFSDIFGFLVKYYVTGVVDWEVGVPVAAPKNRRNLQNPAVLGYHINYSSGSGVEVIGQPDTYLGNGWFPYNLYGNDAGGVHINCGVQNHWFYMLSVGESSTNDLGNSYIAHGIGIEKAAKVTYYNLINNMQKLSTHFDAMEGSVAYAKEEWGECSFEHIETQDAWYAAGVGTWSSCEGAGVNEINNDFRLYPNPTTSELTIDFGSIGNKTIKIYSLEGKVLLNINSINNSIFKMDVSNFSEGVYIININGRYAKFVKR